MNVEIKNICGQVLFSSTKLTVVEALEEAVVAGADLSGADLSGAGIKGFASVSFLGHGECGRTLTALRKSDDTIQLTCGCFSGSPDDLKKYIAEREARLRPSRTLAMETVLRLLDEPKA